MALILTASPERMSMSWEPEPVDRLMPPAKATRVKASSTPSVEERLTEEPVAVISMSSPAEAPVAKMSMPPAEEVNLRESAADSAAVRLMEAPERMSMSPVAEPVEMSMPPASAINWRASAAPAPDLTSSLLAPEVMTGAAELMPVKARTAAAVVWPPIETSTVEFLGKSKPAAWFQ